jgi:HNH endonuclease
MTDPVTCHLCRYELPVDDYLLGADGLAWCADTVECNFRARRRLGMPLHACVAAKANDLGRLAETERARATRLASMPPRPRNPEYDEWLRSSEWQSFADLQRLMAAHRCESRACGRAASWELHVHHLNYDRFGGRERPDDVLVLCPVCHREFDEFRRTKREPVVTVEVVAGPRGHPRRVVTIR